MSGFITRLHTVYIAGIFCKAKFSQRPIRLYYSNSVFAGQIFHEKLTLLQTDLGMASTCLAYRAMLIVETRSYPDKKHEERYVDVNYLRVKFCRRWPTANTAKITPGEKYPLYGTPRQVM